MTPRQAPRVLLIVVAATIVWAVYLVIQRPILRSRGVTSLDWENVVGFPLLIVAMFMVWRFFILRNGPTTRRTRPGIGEAVATGVAWCIIKMIQERYTFGSITLAPFISGIVVFVAVLIGNMIVRRMLQDG